MAPDGSLTPKSNGGSGRHTMKKGPWTAAEDGILMEYVKKHGEGNWNAVQRNSGLMRCGKSCRLRWANHLRPNLKKGSFSSEEENLIVQLHAKLGNKWARMASQLPGRTDNEIKNYWNTRLKRRQRAGLPIYPLDIKPQNHQELIPQINPSSSSLASLLSPSHGQKPEYSTTPLSIFDMFSSPPTLPPPQNLLNPSYLYKNGLALSLSSVNSQFSPRSSSASLAFNNQGSFSQSIAIPSLHLNYPNFGIQSRPVSGSSFEHDGTLAGSAGVGLPSIQSLVQGTTTTTTASSGSTDHYVIATTTASSSDDHGDDETMEGFSQNGCKNSGLLEDLLGESQALTRATKANEFANSGNDEQNQSQAKFLWDYKLMEDAGVSGREESGLGFCQEDVVLHQNYEDSSPPRSLISRAKRMEASSEEGINPVDDDLLSLLDNFPLAVPLPEWYDGNGPNGNLSTGQSSNSTGGNAEKENLPEYSHSPVATPSEMTDHINNWTIGACSWKNLPGIY